MVLVASETDAKNSWSSLQTANKNKERNLLPLPLEVFDI
jgi:hypothetical protein